MTRGIKRTFVWRLLTRDEYTNGWTEWQNNGITKSKERAHTTGVHLKETANRKRQFKVVKVTAKGYSSPFETGEFD